MFSKFFYTCKSKGLNITLGEWLNLQEALDKGLCESSLTKFYYIARMLLVKSETEFDKFDRHNLDYVFTELKYGGYIAKEKSEIEKKKKLDGTKLPKDIDYLTVKGLRIEAAEKLK